MKPKMKKVGFGIHGTWGTVLTKLDDSPEGDYMFRMYHRHSGDGLLTHNETQLLSIDECVDNLWCIALQGCPEANPEKLDRLLENYRFKLEQMACGVTNPRGLSQVGKEGLN